MTRYTEFDFGLTWLSTMFHRDWMNEGDSSAVLGEFLWRGQDSRAVEDLLRDASILAARLLPEEAEALWGCSVEGRFDFGVSEPPVEQWLNEIIRECRLWLRERGCVEGPAAVEVGNLLVEESGEMVAEFAPQLDKDCCEKAGSALIRCVRECSPDLGFRFLLRTLSVAGVDLSAEQYGRFVRLGENLGYGEFVVSNLEFQVRR